MTVYPAQRRPSTFPETGAASCDRRSLSPCREERLPGRLVRLFMLFAAYVVAPLITIPGVGLSWSALLFYVIVLELFVRPHKQAIRHRLFWVRLAIFLWLGSAASFFANALDGQSNPFDFDSAARVLQFAYWMLVFVCSVQIIRQAQVGRQVANCAAAAIAAVAVVVLLERLVLGTISSGTGTSSITRLSQNSYGVQFSTFGSFLLVPVIAGRGKVRWLACLGLLLLWSAAAVNGSRSSWGAMGAATLTFVLLQLVAARSFRGIGVLTLIVGMGVVLVSLTPASVKDRVAARARTMDRLDTDKSYQVRLLMNQKAQRLFVAHPIFGVGPDRFSRSSTPLTLPKVLTYASQDHFDDKSAHNSYMLILAEGGLLHTVPFAILVLALLLRGPRAAVVLYRGGEPWALAAYAGLVGMTIHLWTIVGLTSTGPWMVYAMVAAAIERSRRAAPTAVPAARGIP